MCRQSVSAGPLALLALTLHVVASKGAPVDHQTNLLQNTGRSNRSVAEAHRQEPNGFFEPCLGINCAPGTQGFFEPAPIGNKPTLGFAHGEQWFTRDAERMDELPNYKLTKQKCHPKCKWSCNSPRCDTKCQPICKAPRCATTCKKTLMSRCKRVCKDPQCVVVCPPQCEHGTCPQCKTVCGKSVCLLNCGTNCESHCEDPDCIWDCQPDPGCAKPQCSMKCDTSVCQFGNLQKLPNEHEAPYLGQEVAWKGMGKIPEEHLEELAPLPATKNFELAKGGKYYDKAPEELKPGQKFPSGDYGITKEASVSKVVSWSPERPDQIRHPTQLSAAEPKNWKPVTFKTGRKDK